MDKRETSDAVGPSGPIRCTARHGTEVAAWPGARGRAARARTWLTLVVLLLTAAATSGCRVLEFRDTAPPQPPAGPAQATSEPEAAQPDLATAMDLLESGEGAAARKILAVLAQTAPRSRVVASLLQQIDEPADQLLPGPYRQVRVDAGESLSLIAARELGDPLMFYALARLNEIEIPAQVPVGSVLRVPETAGAGVGANENLTPPAPAEVASEVTTPEIESVAQYLARSGQIDQARAMLIGRLGEAEYSGPESTRELLTSLTLDQAGKLRTQGKYARAGAVIDEALAVLGESSQRETLAGARQDLSARMLRTRALRLREQGEVVEAHRVAGEAAALKPADADALALVDELRAELVDSLHNRALVAWRDRNVDLAIRTWETLLQAIPDFEPARVYLERARLLRERLDEP